jgi:hypothetical protein
MLPTMRTLDQVYVTSDNRFRPGDVILFTDPGSGRKIAHRVLSVKKDRVVTRGDNNRFPDSSVIGPEKVMGRVISVRRNRRSIKVRGGLAGLAMIVPHRIWLFVRRSTAALAVIPYHAISRSGICRIWLPQSMRPRTMSFNGAGGPELRVMMGKRLVGVWRPGYPEWRIVPPYRLFLDESVLPRIPACDGACSAKGASDDDRSDSRHEG